MFALAIAASVLVRGVAAGPYELNERLKDLDVAWVSASEDAKLLASTKLRDATTAWNEGDYSNACRDVDEARRKLEGRSPTTADALSLRPSSLFLSPGATVSIRVRWAYRPAVAKAVRLNAGGRDFQVNPMEERSFDVNALALNPDLRLTPEVGFLVPIQVGDRERHLFVSFVKNAANRVSALRSSPNGFAADMGRLLQSVMDNPENQEDDQALIEYLFEGEQVMKGRANLADLDEVHFARFNSTSFRVAFPREQWGQVNSFSDVVVAFPDRLRSINSFFDQQGRGAAVRAALDRSWVFVSATPGRQSASDVLEWLRNVRHIQPRNVFYIAEGASYASPFADGAGARAVGLIEPSQKNGRIDREIPTFVAHTNDMSWKAWQRYQQFQKRPADVLNQVNFGAQMTLTCEVVDAMYDFLASHSGPAVAGVQGKL
jgi:hypothetical protein